MNDPRLVSVALTRAIADTLTRDAPTRGQRHTAEVIALRAVAVAGCLPAAIHQIDDQLTQLDGTPTTASGADRGPGGGSGRTIRVEGGTVPVTSVEAAVIARLEQGRPPSTDLDRIDDLIATAQRETVKVWHHVHRWHQDRTIDVYEAAERLRAARVALDATLAILDRYAAPVDPRMRTVLRCAGTGTAEGAACRDIADYRIRGDGTIDARARCPKCEEVVASRAAHAAAVRKARLKAS